MTSQDRRQLQFHSLEDAVADARHLLAVGYEPLGKWNLSQTLGHCGDWLSFPMDGYPRGPLPIRMALWLMKITVGTSMRKKVLNSGSMKPGGPTMPETIKTASRTEDKEAVEKFAELVKRFSSHTGPLHSSPLFGKLTRDEALCLQIIHLQHHLSFLLPHH